MPVVINKLALFGIYVWYISQNINRSNLECITLSHVFEVLELAYYFRVTSCHTDLGRFTPKHYYWWELKLKNMNNVKNMNIFASRIIYWIERDGTSTMKECNNLKQQLVEIGM